MKFGFMPGCGATNAIFILRQLQEKYLAKRKIFTLHLQIYLFTHCLMFTNYKVDTKRYLSINMEKAFDRVPRDVVWWALREEA